MSDFQHSFKIAKLNEDERIVWGFGYITRDPLNKFVTTDHTDENGYVSDWSEESVHIDELEKAMYDYVENSREGDTMHTDKITAVMVESMTITPAKKEMLGLPDSTPEGVLLAYRITDDETWKRVKAGELSMFSLAGTCNKEEI